LLSPPVESILEGESSLAYSFFSLPEYVGYILIHQPVTIPRMCVDNDQHLLWAIGSAVQNGVFIMTDRLNLIDTIAKQEKFSTFSKLITSSGANEVLSGPGAFTVFVPTNEAFSKIPTIIMSELLNEPNQTQLKSLLSYHVLSGKVMAANIGSTPTREAFTGEELRFADMNGLKVNGATVLARNIEATNGVVHALDTVLAPSTTTKSVAAAAAASTTGAVPAVVPSAAPSVTGTAIPTTDSVLAPVPTSPSAAAARADIKPIF